MPRHFGVLIPSTNTTAELEYSRLLPESWQPHYARMATSSVNKTPFSPPRDEDLDYQAKMLGTADPAKTGTRPCFMKSRRLNMRAHLH